MIGGPARPEGYLGGTGTSELRFLQKAEVGGGIEDDVIEEVDADDFPGILDPGRNVRVGPGGLDAAFGVVVGQDDAVGAVGDGVREDLAGVDWGAVERPMDTTRTFRTSLAPLMVMQRKCSCLRSAKWRMRGRMSAGVVILSPPGLMRRRANSRAATTIIVLTAPMPSRCSRSSTLRFRPLASTALTRFSARVMTSILVVPCPSTMASNS